MKPSVIGYPFLEAKNELRDAGVPVHQVRITRPPRARYGLGLLRVIGEREEGSGRLLVLAYENYETWPLRKETSSS